MFSLFRGVPRATLLVTLSLLSSMLPLRAAQAGEVVTSIRPLGLIASALTDGITQPQVLLEDGASPHHYALRPSDMRKLTEARIVFWVGPELERFLEKPLARTEAITLALGESDAQHDEEHEDPESHQDQDAHEHEDHEHEDHAAHEHEDHEHEDHAAHEDEDQHEHADDHEEHEHDHGGMDVHPWLDPEKALLMAQKMYPALLEVYPEQHARLEANLAAFQAQMAEVEQQIRNQLADNQEQGFYVFHDAYSGFVEHFGLNQLGYFTVDPGRKPGARHLAEIRHQLEQNNAVCVLSEPQFRPDVVETITSGLPLNQGELDPLAIGRELTATAYGEFLLDLADRFDRCLQVPVDKE